jgi:glycosyltransferase involved in cell wall biosynthesis
MISVIVPFHNEVESLPILINQLINRLKKIEEAWEIILVDDGSTDAYASKFNVQCSRFKIIKHRKRFGKGQALRTGIENAKGDVIVFMDADLQDDPKDLPKFLQKIKEGYDFVNGARAERRDNFLVKIYSVVAALFLKLFLHSPYTDINCGFKVFKREVLFNFIFYANNFRFFPLVVYYQGFKVTEIPVINHPRKYGQSKFGSTKLFIGMIDTLTAYFLYRFSEKPLHFFGIIGSSLFLIGFLLTLYLAIERIFFNILLYRRPILFLGILLIIVGVQIIMTGIIGELIVYLNKKSTQ